MKRKALMISTLVIVGGLWAGVAAAQTEMVVKATEDEVLVGVQYHANSLTEFLWGVTRPVHLWNDEKGDAVILPFWTRPTQPGGLLCWASKKSWKENPSLTLGTLVTEVALVAVAASSGGGGGSGGASSEPEPAVVEASGGGGGGGGGDDGGDESPW